MHFAVCTVTIPNSASELVQLVTARVLPGVRGVRVRTGVVSILVVGVPGAAEAFDFVRTGVAGAGVIAASPSLLGPGGVGGTASAACNGGVCARGVIASFSYLSLSPVKQAS